MTEVLSEVNVTDTVLPIQDEGALTLFCQFRKRVAEKEFVFKEPEVEVPSSLDEVQVDVVLPKGEPEVEYKVACPDCGKQVSNKALKCSHGPNFGVKKQKHSQPTISREDGNHSLGTDATKEQEYQSRMRNRRMKRPARREAIVQKLMNNAFP